MSIARLESPFTPVIIDVTSASVQTYDIDLGFLPIRLSVETNCGGTAATKLYGANDPDGFVQLGSTINSYPSVVEFPTPTFRYFRVEITPTGSQAIKATLHSKF